MAGEPLMKCVVCWERLTVAELAHSPCKHCHVEYCTECLKKSFKIAEQDDVLEVICPNPHCKRRFDAECMKVNPQLIRAWVEKELIERRYGVLDRYKDLSIDDMVRSIINHRNDDLGHLRRTSSIWEEQILSLKLQPKADLNDIPLAPSLLHNQSQERIDLRSKFSPSNLQRSQRSLSLPSKHDIKRIQLFKMAQQHDDDTTDEDSDGDYIQQHHLDNTVQSAGKSTRSKHRKTGTLLDAIIDEDQELNDPHFQSPLASTLRNEFPFEHLDQLPDSLPSSKDSPLSLFDLPLQSPSIHSIRNSHSNPPESALPSNKSSTRRLSASFKSLFKSKSAQSAQTTPKSASSNDMHSMTESEQAHTPSTSAHRIKRKRKRILHRATTHEAQSDEQTRKHVRGGSTRLLQKLTFKNKKKNKSAQTDEREQVHNDQHETKKAKNRHVLDRVTKSANTTPKSMDQEHDMARSKTPDVNSTLHPYNAYRRRSDVCPPKIGVSPPPANTLSLSYRKQLAQLNAQKRKRENSLKSVSHSRPTDDEDASLSIAMSQSKSLPVRGRPAAASMFTYPTVQKLTVNVEQSQTDALNSDQLKPPTHTPSIARSSPGSSPAHTPLSELSGDRPTTAALTVDTAMANLQNAVKISNSASNGQTPSKLSLAPINSTQEQDEIDMTEWNSNQSTQIPQLATQHEEMSNSMNRQQECSTRSNSTVVRHEDESPVTGYSPVPYAIHGHETNESGNEQDADDDGDDEMNEFDINAHLSPRKHDEESMKQLLHRQMDEASGSEGSFQMQSDTEEHVTEEDEVADIDHHNALHTVPATFVLDTPTTTMPMPIPSDFIPPIPNLSATNTMTLTTHNQGLNATVDHEMLPALGEETNVADSALYDNRNDNNNKRMRIANIHDQQTEIIYSAVELRDNDSHSHSKSASPITPQPINTQLAKHPTHGGTAHIDDANADPPTPETPPTPESPQSGSNESGSHFERAMRKIDMELANHEHKKANKNGVQGGMPNTSEQNIEQDSAHRIPTTSDNTPVPAADDVRASSGCACVIL